MSAEQVTHFQEFIHSKMKLLLMTGHARNSELVRIPGFTVSSVALNNATLPCACLIRSSNTVWYFQLARALRLHSLA
jgi:hypothetical protein